MEIKFIGVLITTPCENIEIINPLERANGHIEYKAILTEYLINVEI